MYIFVQRVATNKYIYTNFKDVYGIATLKTMIYIRRTYKLPLIVWIKPLTYIYLN